MLAVISYSIAFLSITKSLNNFFHKINTKPFIHMFDNCIIFINCFIFVNFFPSTLNLQCISMFQPFQV